MKPLPLRRLLLRESLLVVGLGGLGLAGLGWWGARAIMVAQAKMRAEAGLREVERRVQASLQEAVRTGEALAQMGRMGQLAPMDTLAGEQQLLTELSSRPSLSNLTFVLPDGQASAANAPEAQYQNHWLTRGTHFERGLPQRMLHLWDNHYQRVQSMPDPAAPPDWRLRPWVIQGLREGRGSWTPPYLFLGKVGFGLTYTVPVSRGDRPLGVLGVDLVLGDLRPWLNEAKPTEGTRLAILDGDGRLLVPPEQEPDSKDPEASRILTPEPLDTVRHPIPTAIHNTPTAIRPGLWPQIKVGAETFLVQRRRVHLEGGLDWELLMAIPEGDLLREPRKLALATLAACLGALTFLAWRMAWSSRQIAAPLEELAAQAGSLAEAHAITPPETRILELQELARSLRAASIALEEQANLEGHLRQAQRREMIGTLAAGVAHDLGNLISAAGANLELAQDQGLPEASRLRSLGMASTALRRSRGFLRALLTIGRPVEEEPGPIELGQLLRESGALLEPLLGALVTLKVQAPQAPVWIHGDRLQLEQVLLNLAVNGRDAMPKGGLLTLEAGLGADHRPFLAVSDAGQGISPEVKQQLFTPFFTTKSADRGSGLGLAMVQGIARAHGAEIDVESTLGQGSRFILHFPRHPAS
ncbi:ATP-binding protein [Geothrix sp. PMB-07]|uniref:sensor histidine kinase n=1 Tax=Geothrix sp. PMB-07 TaxID=3068640 RepID=UPI0027427CE9|nr:ATP-binding protein [Geothrix sp. PMB-07]WLT33073.1 ATP-binding protein [Geothrix sp. PMB-07]